MNTGKCLCGKIEYGVDDDVDIVVNCHCRFCRFAHGAEFVPVAMMSWGKLDLVKGAEYLSRYEVESVGAFRCFCSLCGTRLFNHSPKFDFLSLIVATLECAETRVPIANVNMESRNMGFEQCNGLPRFDKVPGIDELKQLKLS